MKEMLAWRRVSLWFVCAIIATVCLAPQSNSFHITSTQDYYIGAVFEYLPVQYRNTTNPTRQEALHIMLANLNKYQQAAQEASNQGAQIIVFPELGISGDTQSTRDAFLPFLEPLPLKNQVLCDPSSNSSALSKLSCIAHDNKIVVVANFATVANCSAFPTSKCPSDGRFQFNTNVVFDESGAFIAYYYKTHLWLSDLLTFDYPPVPMHTTFNTSFGVTFGTFICFDIGFLNPPFELVDEYKIQNFVYPTWFVNMVDPDSTVAITIQRAFSLANNVNILAANIGDPASSGSGIYSGGVPLNYTWPLQNDNTLLISKVPKIPLKRESFHPMALSLKSPSLSSSSSSTSKSFFEFGFSTPNVSKSFLATEGLTSTFNLTISNLTCLVRVSVKTASSPPSWYVVMAAKGYFQKVLPVASCSLALCYSHECDEANFEESKTVFSDVEIQANFPSGAVVYPSVLVSGHRLPDSSSFNFTQNRFSSLYSNSSDERDFLYNLILLGQVFSFSP